MTHVHFTLKSANAKTGPIPVSTSTSKTCPASCPFNGRNGCYAQSGPLALHWAAVTAEKRGFGWSEFVKAVAALPDGQLWRHNQAGDLPGEGEWVNYHELGELTAANKGKRGFTYTHKHSTEANLEAIRSANAGGFTINLSANTLEHADKLADANAGPIAVVLPADQTTNTVTPNGRKVVVCPATIRADVSCATCQLCSKAQRSVIVGFPAHGTSKAKASLIAAN